MLGVPDRFFRDWVDDHYRAAARGRARPGHGGAPGASAYEVVEASRTDGAPADATRTVKPPRRRPPRLNERFTFATYVVADSQPAPRGGGRGGRREPGPRLQPALHLRRHRAWARRTCCTRWATRSARRTRAARVVYLSSEEFTNEFVESVRDHRMTEFRRKFRDECDVLLIDDIQFLGKREETQKEFFYTFNALHEMRRPSSSPRDTVPAEIPGLEDRLRSRFTMGLITDIQEPNFETRVAILKKKAEADGFDAAGQRLPLHRPARAEERARAGGRADEDLRGAQPHRPADDRGVRGAGAEGHPPGAAGRWTSSTSSARWPATTRWRWRSCEQDRRHQAAGPRARRWRCTSCRKLTKSSFPEIAARFNKDHSTVISSVRKVERQREADASVRKELDELESKLGPG